MVGMCGKIWLGRRGMEMGMVAFVARGMLSGRDYLEKMGTDFQEDGIPGYRAAMGAVPSSPH